MPKTMQRYTCIDPQRCFVVVMMRGAFAKGAGRAGDGRAAASPRNRARAIQ